MSIYEYKSNFCHVSEYSTKANSFRINHSLSRGLICQEIRMTSSDRVPFSFISSKCPILNLVELAARMRGSHVNQPLIPIFSPCPEKCSNIACTLDTLPDPIDAMLYSEFQQIVNFRNWTTGYRNGSCFPHSCYHPGRTVPLSGISLDKDFFSDCSVAKLLVKCSLPPMRRTTQWSWWNTSIWTPYWPGISGSSAVRFGSFNASELSRNARPPSKLLN